MAGAADSFMLTEMSAFKIGPRLRDVIAHPAASATAMRILLLPLILIGFALYWVPTFIAFRRHHPSAPAIAAVNLFFGWSLIGWALVLGWALSGNYGSGAPAAPWPHGPHGHGPGTYAPTSAPTPIGPDATPAPKPTEPAPELVDA